MIIDPPKWRGAAAALCIAALALPSAAHAQAQKPAAGAAAAGTATVAKPSESEQLARATLTRMAKFLAGTQRFSVNVRADYDAVQESGQKIEFAEARKVTLSRPDRLRVEGEQSDGAKVLTVFNGKEITLVDGRSNVYAAAPQPGGLDQSIIYFVKDLGMRLPLAVLLLSQLPKELEDRVRSIDYVEKTSIYGALSHHLAARTDTVDFQVWIADGDKPLPLRVVITYKNVAGQPQFRAQLSDWNLAPAIADSTFVAAVPKGAQKIAFAAQLPRMAAGTQKPEAGKGAK